MMCLLRYGSRAHPRDVPGVRARIGGSATRSAGDGPQRSEGPEGEKICRARNAGPVSPPLAGWPGRGNFLETSRVGAGAAGSTPSGGQRG
ncbi:hypothetical protein AZA_87062 [Nitrospirillum viridazoti Y2]|nr:hypothetical protein AZA_87062 [Nitrospirillum amazonense Y2]